ncbi:ABC transporter substrate-binding protein [Maridesulfovibrio sp.]|uniref:ABC transporter substrate-binding protein n=1 Tax=Maridesulfovibrio sp. TaxID=2795000 RepID=UPI0029F5C467|nr:ABC transporter substrate-binding protein [Maridesulfovibrio sp.]
MLSKKSTYVSKCLIITAALLSVLVYSLCSASTEQPKVVRIGDLFANTYTSLDPQKVSFGWYTSTMGLSETLFRIDDSYAVVPWLAESASVDGTTWTIKLRDNVCFSDGSKLTSDIAVRCIERANKVNEKSRMLKNASLAVVDEKTFTISTPKLLPTVLNELCNVYMAMVNLDTSKDLDNAPVCTGPFKVDKFDPGVFVRLVRNDNYWGGKVNLDGVEGLYVADADTLSLAFQNGEIDAYIGPTTNDLSIFSASPEKYNVVAIPASRLYYYYLSMERIPDKNLRAAINMSINSDDVCILLAGLASPTVGAYGTGTAYGKITKHGFDPVEAKKLIEKLGYTIDENGYYAKDGKEIELDIAYYAARSIDKIVLLMQEQLRSVGIKANLRVTEDPDGTYMSTGDFDIGVYCMTANPSADPYYFMERVVGGGKYTSGRYNNARAKKLLEQLYSEPVAAQRAKLAIAIQQQIVDDEAMGFLAILNKTTVMRAGVVNCSERNPISFYFLNAETALND